MAKNKLRRFVQMATYPNVISPAFSEVFRTDFQLKGRWAREIFANCCPLVLELGCGRGEYTLALARRHPLHNFIGVDIKGARIWCGATEALESRLHNVAFLRTRIEFITSCFASGELSEIWITFPDPQPQQSRENKRLTSPRFLEAYRNILQPGGIVHLKTDSQLLFDYTRRVLDTSGMRLLACTDNLYATLPDDNILSVQTHYEKIFSARGFTIKYLCFCV